MTVYFRPFGDLFQAPKPRHSRDVMLYAFLSSTLGTPVQHDPEVDVDYEAWIEAASMLEQALRSGVRTVILPPQPLKNAIMAPLMTLSGRACPDILLGDHVEADTRDSAELGFAWPCKTDELAHHYAELAAFRLRAGRRTILADMPGDPEVATKLKFPLGLAPRSLPLGEAMASLAPANIVVKQVRPAKAIPLLAFNIATGTPPHAAEERFFEQTDLHYTRFEGDQACLLVQEKIVMTHETRMIIINRNVVCGAPRVTAHTPQDMGHLVAPLWEIERNSGCFDQSDPDILTRARTSLIGFATQAAAEISRELPGLANYVMDVALDGEGQPLIIDLSPISGARLYASNTGALFRSILAHATSVNMPSQSMG